MEAVSKTFHASIDNGVKIITGSLILFALLFIGGILLFSPNEIKFFLCLINTPLLLIVFFAWLYSPVSYTVSGGDVIINRKIGNVYLHIKDWENVRPVSEHELGRVWRMAGNGGLFGYTGWFSTSLGKMRWYVRQRKNYILITGKKGNKFLISPNDPDAFMQAIAL